MTQKLAQILNLPDFNDDITADDSGEYTPPEDVDLDKIKSELDANNAVIADVNSAIDKIDLALPMVSDLGTTDTDLDELSTFASEKSKDLIDLGMNVDPRFAGPIFQTASVLLGHAITAKTAKMDKKLRMIGLQLQKARLDHQISKDSKAKDSNESAVPMVGQGMVLDRNELLAQILQTNKKQ